MKWWMHLVKSEKMVKSFAEFNKSADMGGTMVWFLVENVKAIHKLG